MGGVNLVHCRCQGRLGTVTFMRDVQGQIMGRVCGSFPSEISDFSSYSNNFKLNCKIFKLQSGTGQIVSKGRRESRKQRGFC